MQEFEAVLQVRRDCGLYDLKQAMHIFAVSLDYSVLNGMQPTL